MMECIYRVTVCTGRCLQLKCWDTLALEFSLNVMQIQWIKLGLIQPVCDAWIEVNLKILFVTLT